MKFLRHILHTILTFLALWALGLAAFIFLIPTSATQDTTNTDAIVVLTGGGLRLERGLSLLIEGRAPLLFVSGVKEGVQLSALLHNKEVEALASKAPLAKIELGYKARSTLQNAEETTEWVIAHKIKSLRLVTASYHMPRSYWVMKHAMPDVAITPEPVFPAEFYRNGWWLTQNGLTLVVSEYHKYLATLLADMLGVTAEE